MHIHTPSLTHTHTLSLYLSLFSSLSLSPSVLSIHGSYAVYLLVFSMEEVLCSDEAKQDATWQYIKHWLNSLFIHAKAAPILMVGTFADAVPERKRHEAISQQLYNRLCTNPAFPNVVHNSKGDLWFWPIDNTKGERDASLLSLRDQISATTLAQEYVKQEVALPYLHLYDKLMAVHRDEDRPLLTVQEVDAIARTCGLPTLADTTACLKFLHMYSMLLYYDSIEGMDQFVILSPQWAVDVITRVVRNFDLHRDVRDKDALRVGIELWQDLTQEGVLHMDVLRVLWNDVNTSVFRPMLQLMMQYGLCVNFPVPKHDTRAAGNGRANQAASHSSPSRDPAAPAAQGGSGLVVHGRRAGEARHPQTGAGPGDAAEPGLLQQKSPVNARVKAAGTAATTTARTAAEGEQLPPRLLVPAILPMTLSKKSHAGSETAGGASLPLVTLSCAAAAVVNPYTGFERNTAFVSFYIKGFKRDPSVAVEELHAKSFIPEGLFTLVLSHVISRVQQSAAQRPQLSRTHARLFVESVRLELDLVPEAGGIKITVDSAQPRALLLVLYTTVKEALVDHFPSLLTYLLVPYDADTLLFFDDVAHHHKQMKAMWVGASLLEHADLEQKYEPLLPRIGIQDQYDAFLSYRSASCLCVCEEGGSVMCVCVCCVCVCVCVRVLERR